MKDSNVLFDVCWGIGNAVNDHIPMGLSISHNLGKGRVVVPVGDQTGHTCGDITLTTGNRPDVVSLSDRSPRQRSTEKAAAANNENIFD